jgi:hypothetical protein
MKTNKNNSCTRTRPMERSKPTTLVCVFVYASFLFMRGEDELTFPTDSTLLNPIVIPLYPSSSLSFYKIVLAANERGPVPVPHWTWWP